MWQQYDKQYDIWKFDSKNRSEKTVEHDLKKNDE
jgi:hypothetical protein